MRITDCMVGEANLSADQATDRVNFAEEDTDFIPSTASLGELAIIGAMCNAGEFDASTSHLPLEDRKIFGDAIDQAILRFVEGLHPVSSTRSCWKAIHKIPFNSKNKFMVYAVQPADKGPERIGPKATAETTLMIKGAPDILLLRCTKWMTEDGTTITMTDEMRSKIEETKDMWSQQAKRVILLARRPLDTITAEANTSRFDQEVLRHIESGLELIGLVAVIDPPREEIPEVVSTLRRAGIKVHMVTGDFRLTAQAIASECGIITQSPDRINDVSALTQPDSPQLSIIEDGLDTEKFSTNYLSTRSLVLSGTEMMALTDEQWDELCKYDEEYVCKNDAGAEATDRKRIAGAGRDGRK